MLPGFRFLLAAILLSTSILVFGLGAAALLRASHEQYVSNPSWRNGPQEQVFAQAPEPTQPVLAVLRAEPELAPEPAPSLRDQVPTIALPVSGPEQMAAVTTETDAKPEVTEAAPAIEPAKTETKTETKAETKTEATVEAAAPAPADTLTPADTTASLAEVKPAATASAPAEPAAALSSSALDPASAKVVAVNNPVATAKDHPAKAKADTGTPESKAAKPRAHRVKKRRRIVRRPPPPVQQLDAFGQPQPTLATTTTRARQ